MEGLLLMSVALLNTMPLVSSLVTSARALITGSPGRDAIAGIVQAASEYRDSDLHVHLQPLLRLAAEGGDGRVAPSLTTEQLAVALREATVGLTPHVNAREREYLARIHEKLGALVTGAEGARPTSGIFQCRERRPVAVNDGTVERQWTEDLVVLVGGAFHDAANTLTPLDKELRRLKQVARELCAMESHFAEVTPIGSTPGRLGFLESLLVPVDDVSRRCDGSVHALRIAAGDISDARKDPRQLEEVARRLFADDGILNRTRGELEGIQGLTVSVVSSLETIDAQREGDVQALPDVSSKYAALRDEAFLILHGIRRLLDRAEGMVETVLEVNRAGSGAAAVDLFQDLHIDLLQVVMGRNARVSLEIARDLPRVAANSRELWRVLINLMTNARRAMGEAGSFDLAARPVTLDLRTARGIRHGAMPLPPRAGDFIVIEARDSGPGIAAADLEKIFQPFYSGERSTGYGLAVVLSVIEGLGGFLGVDSIAEGDQDKKTGTTFSVYLPRA